jgi:hypothetical protein
MRSLMKLLVWTLWAVSIFGWYSAVTVLLNASSTILVVFGVFVAVIALWATVKSAQFFWRMN